MPMVLKTFRRSPWNVGSWFLSLRCKDLSMMETPLITAL